MKTICKSTVLAAVLTLSALPVFAGGVGSVSFGITNATITGFTTNGTLGVSTVPIDQQTDCTLTWASSTVCTNAATIVLTLAPVDGNGVIYTNDSFTWTFNQISNQVGTLVTNAIVKQTNITASVIGANYGLALISVGTTTAAGPLISPTLTAWKKRLQAGN